MPHLGSFLNNNDGGGDGGGGVGAVGICTCVFSLQFLTICYMHNVIFVQVTGKEQKRIIWSKGHRGKNRKSINS